MSWTLTTSGSAICKAGAYANSTIVASGSLLATFSDEVEAKISGILRYDLVTNWSNVKTNFKPFLEDLASDMIALKILGYDPSTYGSREIALIVNMLVDNAKQSQEILRQDKIKEVILTNAP